MYFGSSESIKSPIFTIKSLLVLLDLPLESKNKKLAENSSVSGTKSIGTFSISKISPLYDYFHFLQAIIFSKWYNL